MCLMCIEISKERMKPKDFWRNYREVPEDHRDDLIQVVADTSVEYQAELAQHGTDEE